MEFLGCGVFWLVCFLMLWSFWVLFCSDAVFFGLVLFGFFGGRFFSVFGVLPSFASSYRFIFACFGCFLWLVCCSARLLLVAYFYFFKGSGLLAKYKLLFLSYFLILCGVGLFWLVCFLGYSLSYFLIHFVLIFISILLYFSWGKCGGVRF